MRESIQKAQDRKAAPNSPQTSSTTSGTGAGIAATPTSSVIPNAGGIAPFTGSTSAQATSVYTAIVKAAPAAPKAKVIKPYTAEGVVNTFFPSESYPDGGFGKAASVSLTLGAIVSGIVGALALKGKLALDTLSTWKIFG